MMKLDCFGSYMVGQCELVNPINGGEYDLFLTTVGWEARANFALSKLAGFAKRTIGLRFESSAADLDEKKSGNQEELLKAIPDCKLVNLVGSTRVQENFARLRHEILEEYRLVGRPLRVVVDISCLPKSYILFLLGLGLSQDLFACFDSLYTPGKYDLVGPPDRAEPSRSVGPRSLISVGEWTSVQIPYLTADQFMPSSRDLIVTLGGEIGLSLPFIERTEPRNLSLIFISESAPNAGKSMHKSEAQAYAELMEEPNVARFDVGLSDMLGVARFSSSAAQGTTSGGVTGMAIGSKSHALGLGLAALIEGKLDVVCRIPTGYSPLDVHPRGDVHFYRIVDRFEPHSYFIKS